MNKIEELKKLKSLLDQGALTETEYNKLVSELNIEQSNVTKQESINISESIIKLKKRLNKLRNWVLLLSLVLVGVIILEWSENHVKIKNFFKSFKTKTEASKTDKDSLVDKNIIYKDGNEIGRIVTRKITGMGPNSFGVKVLDIPEGKMWTLLYYESPNHYEPRIYPIRRVGGWRHGESYLLESTKSDFVSIKYSKLNSTPLIAKNQPATELYAPYDVICTLYIFEESVDY